MQDIMDHIMRTKKFSDVDYVIATLNRRKSQRLCHINMLKKYQGRTLSTSAIVTKQLLVTFNCVIQDLDLEQYRAGCE